MKYWREVTRRNIKIVEYVFHAFSAVIIGNIILIYNIHMNDDAVISKNLI